MDPTWASQGFHIYNIQGQNQPSYPPSQLEPIPSLPAPSPSPHSQPSQVVLDWQDNSDDEPSQARRQRINRQGLLQLSDDDKLAAL